MWLPHTTGPCPPLRPRWPAGEAPGLRWAVPPPGGAGAGGLEPVRVTTREGTRRGPAPSPLPCLPHPRHPLGSGQPARTHHHSPGRPSRPSSLGVLALLGDPVTTENSAAGAQSPCPQTPGQAQEPSWLHIPALSLTHHWTWGACRAFRAWRTLGTHRRRITHPDWGRSGDGTGDGAQSPM